MLSVRKANRSDYETVMKIYGIAQDFMIRTGNPNQWRHTHPAGDLIREDIEKGICHVICEDEKVRGVFALCEGEDPTYGYIEDGKWLNEEAYVTIHRIASDQQARGILKTAVEYCEQYVPNIRIDTHQENLVMQKALDKLGFVRCGIIYLKNGEPRVAFQRIRKA